MADGLDFAFYEELYADTQVNDSIGVTVIIGRPIEKWRFWICTEVNPDINLLAMLDHCRSLLMKDSDFSAPTWIYSQVKTVRLASRDKDPKKLTLTTKVKRLKNELMERDEPVLQFILADEGPLMYAKGSPVHVVSGRT